MDGRPDRLVVVVSVGHPNQRGPHPGDCLNFVVAGVEVSDHLVGGELRIVGVGVGVIHDLVSRVGKCFTDSGYLSTQEPTTKRWLLPRSGPECQ